MEEQSQLGEYRQRLPGEQCDGGGDEPGRFPKGTPGQRDHAAEPRRTI